ncbi:hypothetical protein LguiA_013863 [Lonicera macranthoides]
MNVEERFIDTCRETMEANNCDINHLDADVLLPPRKRLLAGLKKQNFDGNSNDKAFTSSSSSEFDSRMINLLRSHSSNPNLSVEEMVESSRLAAEAAVKVAVAARTASEEKAALAAKAMDAAKSALEMVAIVNEETNCKDRNLKKKNKLKRHIPVQMLYSKSNCKTDEELARKLHQAINSSPRISKNSSSSDLKGHKHRRLRKSLSLPEKTRVSNGNGITGEVDSGSSTREAYAVRVDENTSKFNKDERLNLENGKGVTIHSEAKNGDSLEDMNNVGRKRGRIKQKKLPLSICNFRDQANPKGELKSRRLLTEESTGKASTSKNPPMWKCQEFKTSTCVKRSKVMQL